MVPTNVSSEFTKKQIIHLEGMKGSFECTPASEAGAIFLPRVCAPSSLMGQPLSVRSELIKLCLVHAFRAARVGELFEIGFLLMNESVQLSVTIQSIP